jgi:hypothetical protein
VKAGMQPPYPMDSMSQHGMVIEAFSSFMVILIFGMSGYYENDAGK